MEHFSQPPLPKNPNAQMVIINVDANDFDSNCLLKKIANYIVNLAIAIKNEIQSENVMIMPRSDQFEKIVNEVNKAVKELCACRNFSCIGRRWKCSVLVQLGPVKTPKKFPY